jgi:hypothetical protein
MRTISLCALAAVLLAAPALGTGFTPGDKLYLTPRPAGPVVMTFEGVPDTDVAFKVKRMGDSTVVARLVLVSPTGARRDLGTASARKGKLKAKAMLDQAGTWSLEFLSADGSSGDIKVKTKAKVPGKFKDKVEVPDGGTVDFEFHAVQGALLGIKLKGSIGPVLDELTGPGGGAIGLPAVLQGSRKLSTTLSSAPQTGLYRLRIGGQEGGGTVKVKVKVSSPEGGDEIDERVTEESGEVVGAYGGGVLSLTGGSDFEFGVLYGDVDFDGSGGFTHAMENVTIVRDATAPGGFRLERTIPGGAVPGVYTVNDGVATLDFDPGSVSSLQAEMDVLIGGKLLLPRPEAGEGAGTGFLARRAGVSKSDLDGAFLYLFIEQSLQGDDENREIVLDVEAGLLNLDGKGGLLGGGLELKLVLDQEAEGGVRTESSETVLAFGSYSVDGDGEVTFSIRRSLLGPSEETEVRALFDGNLMFSAGTNDDDGIFANLVLSQSASASTADAVGDYRHIGSRTSGGSSLQTVTSRAGTLTLDGKGGFAGAETVTVTTTRPGQEPQVDEQTNVAVSGTYAITPFDLQSIVNALLGGGQIESLLPLTMAFAGEGSVGGIVGPDADYMMAFSLEGGLGFDLLIRE